MPDIWIVATKEGQTEHPNEQAAQHETERINRGRLTEIAATYYAITWPPVAPGDRRRAAEPEAS